MHSLLAEVAVKAARALEDIASSWGDFGRCMAALFAAAVAQLPSERRGVRCFGMPTRPRRSRGRPFSHLDPTRSLWHCVVPWLKGNGKVASSGGERNKSPALSAWYGAGTAPVTASCHETVQLCPRHARLPTAIEQWSL